MAITIEKNDNNIDITTNTDSLIIANNVSGETITVDKEQTSVVTVSSPGPKGDPYQYGSDDHVLVGAITASNILVPWGGFIYGEREPGLGNPLRLVENDGPSSYTIGDPAFSYGRMYSLNIELNPNVTNADTWIGGRSLTLGNTAGTSHITASVAISSSNGFIGDLTGNADSATQVYVAEDNTGDTSNSILFSNSPGAGNRTIYEDNNLIYDNTNNNLHVGGRVYSNNTFTIGMSGLFANTVLGNVFGPSIEGKFGVTWTADYGDSLNFPLPSASETCIVYSALAAAGQTIPYKCTIYDAQVVIGGARWKDDIVVYLVYYPPRTTATPANGATETGYYLGPFYHTYSCPNTVDSTYGLAAPSLATLEGEITPFLTLEQGGFVVPVAYNDNSTTFYADIQMTFKRKE